jgi:arabinosyltransferase C
MAAIVGVLAGLALPFCPVRAQITQLTWPVAGQPVVSSTAILTPYRPRRLLAVIPCSVLRAAAVHAEEVMVMSTGTGANSLTVDVTASAGVAVTVSGHRVGVTIPDGNADCRLDLDAGPAGVRLTGPGPAQITDLPGLRVPQVFGFRTGLPFTEAAGTQVSVLIADPFSTSPGALKTIVIAVQLLAAAGALWWLPRPQRWRRPGRRRWRWRCVWWIDVVVVGVLAGWAVIGPLAVDDGWATMIARTMAATGDPGNYFRWWNAAEVPFALDQQLLAPMTTISLAPLWLRLPSTILAIGTWWVLTRVVLRAALPLVSADWRVRGLAAICLLAAWLPFNLGTRPESYVALGVTAVLGLAMRVQTPAGVGGMLLIAALTAPISPSSIVIAAPMLVFAPRLVAILRASAPARIELAAEIALLACIASVALTLIFADQTWDALVVATDWHAFFGPSLSWYEEPVRYRYLLQDDQQGSFAKRLPVLLAVAMVPMMAAHVGLSRTARVAARLAAVVAAALLLFALSPSKWSYHLGAAAGLFAALITVAIVALCRRAPAPSRYRIVVGAAGVIATIGVAALAFGGPNAWWLPVVYDVPWAATGPRPLGLPLASPTLWLALFGVAILAAAATGGRQAAAKVVTAGPAPVAVVAIVTALLLMIGSFVAAPIRRPTGSLALINLRRITGSRVCGLADDVEVLPDGKVLVASGEAGEALEGFTPQGGFVPIAPPPDPPGIATSAFVWGSRGAGVQATAQMTSRWFALPALAPDDGVALSVSGRTGDGNRLTLEFGESAAGQVTILGGRVPPDRPLVDEDPLHPLWRTIGVDAADIPMDANRVRIRAVDTRSDPFGWLALTGPRLRSIVPLNRFLAAHGPVLISWPSSFLFPCVHNIAAVNAGVAQTPNTVIESPRPWFREDRDPNVGGTFAELAKFGELHEIPTRLVGHPEVDWGSLLVSGDDASRDAYQRTVTEVTVSGIGGSPHLRAER